jgi:hypothetical protein
LFRAAATRYRAAIELSREASVEELLGNLKK